MSIVPNWWERARPFGDPDELEVRFVLPKSRTSPKFRVLEVPQGREVPPYGWSTFSLEKAQETMTSDSNFFTGNRWDKTPGLYREEWANARTKATTNTKPLWFVVLVEDFPVEPASNEYGEICP